MGGERQGIVLVTGASRGVGAETARILATRGYHVVINYREKRQRAVALTESITTLGGSSSTVGADITDPEQVASMMDTLRAEHGSLDALVLNASGGLERGAAVDYAMRVNHDAQLRLVDAAMPVMSVRSRLVFVTSHQAHFVATHEVPDDYRPVAQSKRAGEESIRRRESELAQRGVDLSVVSGDMIDGSIVVRLLERRDQKAVDARRNVAQLPTVDEFARAVSDEATRRGPESSRTVFVGGGDYLSA